MTAEEGTREMTFGIADNCEDLVDKILAEHDESCPSLVSCLEEQGTEPVDSCSIETVSNTCQIYKYYSEESIVEVQGHFTRSLQGLTKLMNSKLVESEIPMKPTGRSKRKSKRKTVTSSAPFNVLSSTAVQPQAHSRTATARHCGTRYILPARVDMYPNVEPYFTPAARTYSFQYKARTNEYNVNLGDSGDKSQHSAYSAFCNGKTLIEVYSPTVGRGFNPRYNSLLIEPTVEPYVPPLTGQPRGISPVQDEMQAFLYVAVEFNIPKQ